MPASIGRSMAEGPIYNMSIVEYHAREELSSSQLKRAEIDPRLVRVPTPISAAARRDGDRLHCAILEPEQVAVRYVVAPDPAHYPEALRTAADMRAALKSAGVRGYSGKPVAELVAMVRDSVPNAVLWDDVLSEHGADAAGKEFVSAEEWRQMERAHDAARAHAAVTDLRIFEGRGRAETSWFCDLQYDEHPPLFGVRWAVRARPDWIAESGRVVDVKTWQGGRPLRAFYADAERYSYDLSAALYLDVLRGCGETVGPFSWLIVDKSTLCGPVRIELATIPDDWIAAGRRKIHRALEAIHDHQQNPHAWTRLAQRDHIAERPAWAKG